MRSLTLSFPILFLIAAAVVAEPVTVRAPADPPSVETWTFEEVWRIDGDDPDAPLIGLPQGAAMTPDGNVLLLDHQLVQVLVLSPAGDVVRTVGRAGDGPGELQRPSGLIRRSDGAIGVYQIFPPKIEWLAPDGSPISRIAPTASGTMWWKVREAAGVVVASGSRTDWSDPSASERPTRNFVSRVDDDGEETIVFQEKTTTTDWKHPVHDELSQYFPGHSWALLPDGALVHAVERDAYRLEFFGPDGECIRIVDRPFTPYGRTPADFEALEKNVHYTRGDEILEVETNFLPGERAIQSLQTTADGTILVTSCWSRRDLPEDVTIRWDVFTPEGEFLHELRFVCDYDRDRDSLWVLEDDHVLIARNTASAAKAMYEMVNEEEEEEEDGDVVLDVVLLRRSVR